MAISRKGLIFGILVEWRISEHFTLNGTKTCDKITGVCPCKLGYTGSKCNECKDGYFGFPNCTKCDCNDYHTVDGPNVCNKIDGSCKCKPGYGGYFCSDCAGYYVSAQICSEGLFWSTCCEEEIIKNGEIAFEYDYIGRRLPWSDNWFGFFTVPELQEHFLFLIKIDAWFWAILHDQVFICSKHIDYFSLYMKKNPNWYKDNNHKSKI